MSNTTESRESNEILFLRANEIMNDSVAKAGDLLMEKPEISEIILKQVLKVDPEHLSALQLLGLCKHRMGQNAEAIEIIQTALDIDPDNADNWNNIGLSYGALGNQKKAIECIQKAISLKPQQFLFKNNIALQYRSLGDYENAIKYIKEAISTEEQPQLWLNLGGMYGEMKNLDESEACFKNALKINPEYAAAHVDLAFVNHLNGKWKEGFQAYEWRFYYYPQMKFYHHAYDMNKVWDGKSDLSGKKVLIYGEQGLGDIIQFSRYIPDLKKLGAYVIVHCPVSLDAVIRRIDGVDETTNKDIVNLNNEKFPDYDYQFAIMSFPYLLNIQKIEGKPYIKPATYKFKDYIKSEHPKSFNIGIVWAGSPAHPHDKKRSIPLKFFRVLHNIEGVKLFSLQLESAKRQYGVTYRNMESDVAKITDTCVEKFHAESGLVDYNEDCDDMKIIDLTNMIQSFDDTCTILSGLDLLICCDTATAHIAGAMGVPVWVAVPYNPDWRWTISGNSTHWYDSMKIYRQIERDNWQTVFDEIKIDLEKIINKK